MLDYMYITNIFVIYIVARYLNVISQQLVLIILWNGIFDMKHEIYVIGNQKYAFSFAITMGITAIELQ